MHTYSGRGIPKHITKDGVAQETPARATNKHNHSKTSRIGVLFPATFRLDEIPSRKTPIAYAQDDISSPYFPQIAIGNHAEVHRAGKYFVLKVLDADEKAAIKRVTEGVAIISQIDEKILWENNILAEKIIFASELHLQYVARRLNYGAKHLMTRSTNAITHKFAIDATRAILFLNAKNIMYGNIKLDNWICYEYKREYNFFLQDFGGIAQLESDAFGQGFHSKISWNTVMNSDLYQLFENGCYRQLDPVLCLKLRNLSGLIHVIYYFHFSLRISTVYFSNFILYSRNNVTNLKDFLRLINITSDREIYLLNKLCFSTKADFPTLAELTEIESILTIFINQPIIATTE